MPDAPDWGRREAHMLREPPPSTPDDTDAFPILNPRLFRTRDGRVWLERMSRALMSPSMGAEPSEARLRYFEAQRDILRGIMRHIEAAERAEETKKK